MADIILSSIFFRELTLDRIHGLKSCVRDDMAITVRYAIETWMSNYMKELIYVYFASIFLKPKFIGGSDCLLTALDCTYTILVGIYHTSQGRVL